MLKVCENCPRRCKCDRTKSVGFCGEQKTMRIAKIIRHFKWEEPCLCQGGGTLAIFFSGCNLKCDYCQNIDISRGGVGQFITPKQLAKLLEAEQENHSSIDLITPTHFLDQLEETFSNFRKKVPVIWNTSGYESVENIQKIGKFADIFLTDLKYADNDLAMKFSKCNDYLTVTLPAIKKMCEIKTDIFEGENLRQGVVIRHLVLPGYVQNSLKVLDLIKENFPDRIVSIMSQFTPNGHGELKRKLQPIEYKIVLLHLEKLGLEKGYIQDFESASCEFVPNFI